MKNRLDSYRDYVDFEKTCDAMSLSEAERAEALRWSRAQYTLNKRLLMPLMHNVKRGIFVAGKVKDLFAR